MGLFGCGKKCQRRQDRKDKKLELKYGYKNNRVEQKFEAHTVAYENGISPNAWIGETVGTVADAVTDMASMGVFDRQWQYQDFGSSPGTPGNPNTGIGGGRDFNDPLGDKKGPSPLLLIGGGFLLMKILKLI